MADYLAKASTRSNDKPSALPTSRTAGTRPIGDQSAVIPADRDRTSHRHYLNDFFPALMLEVNVDVGASSRSFEINRSNRTSIRSGSTEVTPKQ